jgi:hypothetical protein
MFSLLSARHNRTRAWQLSACFHHSHANLIVIARSGLAVSDIIISAISIQAQRHTDSSASFTEGKLI